MTKAEIPGNASVLADNVKVDDIEIEVRSGGEVK